MRLFFLDLLKFLAAVVTHWQAYATGGVVTAVVNAIERLTKLRLTKAAYIGLFIVTFLFVAFFLAWHDELNSVREANKTIEIRDAQLAQLKRPSIGDPLVRVTHFEIDESFYPLSPGRLFWAKIDFANSGQLVAHDVQISRYFAFISYDNANGITNEAEPVFAAIYADRQSKLAQPKQDAFPSDPHWFTVEVKPIPTKADIDSFHKWSRVPCLGVRFDWDGGHWSEFCAGLTPDGVWHYCTSHNESR